MDKGPLGAPAGAAGQQTGAQQSPGWRCSGNGRLGRLLQEGLDIFLYDPPLRASAIYLAQIDPLFIRQAAGYRRGPQPVRQAGLLLPLLGQEEGSFSAAGAAPCLASVFGGPAGTATAD